MTHFIIIGTVLFYINLSARAFDPSTKNENVHKISDNTFIVYNLSSYANILLVISLHSTGITESISP
jgi:hypothetical protein